MIQDKMLKFVDINRNMPTKRVAKQRSKDYDEIYQEFATEKAIEQASRCSQCGVPFCQTHCPLHNNIPDWLRLTAQGRFKEAYEISQYTNSFPEICGRICPQDRLCEGSCVIEQSGHGTVTIGAIEKYITDKAWTEGWVQSNSPQNERDENVAIIGAGPAGLAAADRLRARGVQVTIYDRYDRAGGLLTYGIPSFKLEKDIVARRINQLKTVGVKFQLNTNIGTDISFSDIYNQYDAVLIATGVYKSRDLLDIDLNLAGIIPAIDYLTASNKVSFGDDVIDFNNGNLNAKGKRVIVIGGGDTAMDCVRTAIRQGAKSVKCLYRRDRKNMPGSVRETQNAEEEGVEFVWLTTPKKFIGNDTVSGVSVSKMRLSATDNSGRQTPEEISGSDYIEKADLIITALGFNPEDLPNLWNVPELAVTNWGTIKANYKTHETAIEGVYAAGDIVRGASLVVWGIKDGRDAADSILNRLNARVAKAAK